MDNNNNNKPEKKSFAKAFAEGWSRMPAGRKALTIAGMILSVAVIVLAALSLTGVWENSGLAYVPLLGALMLTQAAQNWKTRKGLAIFSIVAALFVFLCWVAVVFFTR